MMSPRSTSALSRRALARTSRAEMAGVSSIHTGAVFSRPAAVASRGLVDYICATEPMPIETQTEGSHAMDDQPFGAGLPKAPQPGDPKWSLVAAIRNRIVEGLILVLPFAITFWVIAWLYRTLRNLLLDAVIAKVVDVVFGAGAEPPAYFVKYVAPAIAILVILFGLLSATALNMMVVPIAYLRFSRAGRRADAG